MENDGHAEKPTDAHVEKSNNEGRTCALREMRDFGAQPVPDGSTARQNGDVAMMLERAVLRASRSQPEVALDNFQKILEVAPDDRDVLAGKVVWLGIAGRLDEAENFIDKTSKRLQDEQWTCIARGLLDCVRHEYDKAVEKFAEAGGEEGVGNGARVLELLTGGARQRAAAWDGIPIPAQSSAIRAASEKLSDAMLLLSATLENIPDAALLLRAALEKSRESVRLHEELGFLFLKRGRYYEAVEPLLRAGNEAGVSEALKKLETDSHADELEQLLAQQAEGRFPAGQVLVWRGRIKLLRTRYDEAASLFDEALRADPDNPDAWVSKMYSLRLRDYDWNPEEKKEALKFAEEAGRRFRDDATVLTECGIIFDRAGQQDRALELFDRALAKKPDFGDVSLLKVKILRKQGKDGRPEKLDEAEKFLLERLRRSAKDTELLTQLGLLRYDQKRYEEAFETFIEAGDAATLRSVLRGLQMRDKPEELKKLLGKVLKAFPEDKRLPKAAGRAYYDNGLSEEALKVLDEPGLASLVSSLRFMGDMDSDAQRSALALADEAVRRFPESASLKKARGDIYCNLERYEEAVDDFIKVGGKGDIDDGVRGVLTVVYELRKRRRFEEAERLLAHADKSITDSALSAPLAYELGDLRYSRGEFDSALGAFKRALKRDPDYEAAALGNIQILYALQRPDAAEACVEAAKRKFQASPHFWNMLSAIYTDLRKLEDAVAAADTSMGLSDRGSLPLRLKISALRLMSRAATNEKGRKAKFEEAERLAEEGLKKSSEDADLRIERGLLYSEQDRFEDAEECFETACKVAPEQSYTELRARLCLTDILAQLGRMSDVQRLFESMKKSFPDYLMDVSGACGWFHVQRGELDRATEEFEECLKLDDQSLVGLNGLGGVNFEIGLYEKAEEYFRRASRLAPNDPTYHANLGWAVMRCYEEWRFEEAERECRRALEIDSTQTGAYGCLGVIAFKRGRLRQSEDYFLDSLRYGKREGNRTDLGALYVQMGRYEEAKKHLDEAIKINDNDFQAHLELGNLYVQTEKIKEAVWEFRRTKALNPHSEEAHHSLAAALMRAGDAGEAEQVLRSGLKSLDSNKGKLWRLHLLLSQLLVKRGEDTDDDSWFKDAQEAADAAIRHAPARKGKDKDKGAGDPYLQRGIVNHKLGENHSAAKDFRKCLEYDPNHYDAKRNLKLVSYLHKREKRLEWGSLIGGLVLGVSSVALLSLLWYFYLYDWSPEATKEGRVTEKVLLIMSPILLGLVVVASLLPYLAKLKMPGLEAELTKPQMSEAQPSGPKGPISVSLPSSSGGGPR